MAGNVLFSALLIVCTLLYQEDRHADKVRPGPEKMWPFV